MKSTATFTNGLVALAAFFVTSIPFAAQAALQVSYEAPDQQKDCHVMLAGQHIEAGQVCLQVEGENLLVTYEMEDGWELVEAHLWAGLDLATMPQSKAGNPKIGNFPYNSGNITGTDSHTFTVPLEVFGNATPCDVTGLLAAHAAVRKANSDGSYQTETGWLEGTQIALKGSWAMNSSVFFTCPADPAPEVAAPIRTCETAYAFGDQTFKQILDSPRWGWQITVPEGTEMTQPIYAAAGGNDISKGTEVGELAVSYKNGQVSVSYMIADGFDMEQVHLYVGENDLPSLAPGSYTVKSEELEDGTKFEYTISQSADSVNVVAHAVVCGDYK